MHFHLKPLTIPDLDSLDLQDDHKQALLSTCESYNQILHQLEEMRQRHDDHLEMALLFQKNMDKAKENLFQARAHVNQVTNLARTHLDTSCKHLPHILDIG